MLGCPCYSKGAFARSLVRSNGVWDREESPDRSPEQLATIAVQAVHYQGIGREGIEKIPCSVLRAGLLLPWCVAVLTGSVAGMSRTIDSQDRAARSIVIAGSQWVARSIGGLHGTDVCQHVNRQQWGIGRGINRQIKIGRDREGSGDRSQDQHGVRVSSWPVQVVPIPGGVDQGSTDRG